MMYKLTKIGKVDNAVIPNSDYGDSQEFFLGTSLQPPTVDESFRLYPTSFRDRGIVTSTVVEVVDDSTFKTLNSVYKIEEFKLNLEDE